MTSLFGELFSFYLEFAGPLISIKPAIEAMIGRDFVTREKLNDFERVMSIIASIPILGTITKIVKYSSKFAKFSNRSNKVIEIINNIFNDKYEIDLGKHINESLRGMQDSISETVDFLRYDDNLIAITIRIIMGTVCILLLPIIPLIVKFCCFLYGLIEKKTEEENDKQVDNKKEEEKSFDIKEEEVNDELDKIMKKLYSRGYNVRFIENIIFPYLQIFFYCNLDKVTEEVEKKIRGLESDAAKKYQKEKINTKDKIDFVKIICDEKQWIKHNNEIYKFNIGLQKAKMKAIKDCSKKNEKEKKNKISGYLSKVIRGFNFLMKNNFGNYKKNKA